MISLWSLIFRPVRVRWKPPLLLLSSGQQSNTESTGRRRPEVRDHVARKPEVPDHVAREPEVRDHVAREPEIRAHVGEAATARYDSTVRNFKKSKFFINDVKVFSIATLQRDNTENSKQIFTEKELCGLSPISTFMCLWTIYIFHSHDRSAYSATGKYRRTDPGSIYINRSQTHECGNWDWGHAIPFLGTHKWNFRCSALLLFSLVKRKCRVKFLFRAVHRIKTTGQQTATGIANTSWQSFRKLST